MKRIIGAAVATIAIATLFRWLAGPEMSAAKAGPTESSFDQRATEPIQEAALEPELEQRSLP